MGPSGAGAIILTTYFLILIYRAFFSVVFAFLLRFSMNWLHAEKLWEWTLAGALISLPMGLAVHWASVATDASGMQGAGLQVATLLFLGLRGIVERHILITFPVAALNSMLLFLIHRAFTKEHTPLENGQK